MTTIEENKQKLIEISSFLGGDNEDTPISEKSIKDMEFIIDAIDRAGCEQPEIFPWAGGDGVQAEWHIKCIYIELSSSSKEIRINCVSDNKFDLYTSCLFDSIFAAVNMIKILLYISHEESDNNGN